MMPEGAPPKVFKLPRVRWADHGVQLLSFRRDELHILGEYLPGEGAAVVNPLVTGVKSPEAIARHELRHQSLEINTTFGIFTQMLFWMARQGFARGALRKCLVEQWCVQELAAIYAETSYVAATSPAMLQEQIRDLPSGRLDQPPYREVFEAMNRFLPVDPGEPIARLRAQDVLVALLASAAMNSECLLRMAVGPGTESSLLACMADSPSSRLERIMNRLIAAKSLEPLLAETIAQMVREPYSYSAGDSPGTVIYERLISLIPEVSIQTDADLLPQATRAASVYEAITGRRVQFPSSRSEPMVKIMESREKEQESLTTHPPRKIPAARLRELFIETMRRSLGLTLELAVLETGEAHVIARPYYLSPNQAPQPASSEEFPREPLPEDLIGLMSARSVLRQLRDFPTLPHVAIFIDDSWRFWQQIPSARERFQSCIRVCRQTHLSREFMADNILPFEDIGHRAEVFVIRLSNQLYVGCFFNRERPLVYGLQKIAGDFALELFSEISSDLGLQHCAEARQVVPHVNLLEMISKEYGL
jgi:hypothetical protein